MMVPEKPATGDKSPVMDALRELIDAGGGLEFSRGELIRVIAIERLNRGLLVLSTARSGGSVATIGSHKSN